MKRSVTPDSTPTATPPDLSAGGPAFEMTTADERFLAEAKHLELSPLESCHYKTLKECTAEMDPDTWNAYHIVSNRARSVCYATRHLQFRKKTEMTVNSLISTATNQLDTMKALKDGQMELKELTSASLDKVLSSQSSLLEQQSVLKEGQSKLETSIDTNLERLAQERALIASGQQLVAQLIENITWRMESNAAGFVVYQNRTVHYYEQLMSNLQRMNTTLGNLADFVDSMHNSMEHRLQHIQSFISWAGFNLATLSTCILHAGYFLLAALLMSFLQTPGFSRAVLLVLVVLNALAELNHQTAMDFRSLSVFLIITAIGNWFLLKLAKGYALSRHQSKLPAMPLTCSTSKYETNCDGIYSSTPKESTSGRYRCNGFTKTGQPCKNRVAQGQEFCRVHDSINTSKNTSGL
ncbi:BMBL protein, partial [Polypterus senegalus]